MALDVGTLPRQVMPWTVDVTAVGRAAINRVVTGIHATWSAVTAVTHVLGTDERGPFLECRDLAAGVLWRARVTDQASGVWEQEIWCLAPTDAPGGYHEPSMADLALEVMRSEPPVACVEHVPHLSDGTQNREWRDTGITNRDDVDMVYLDLWEAADVTRFEHPWVARLGLTDVALSMMGPRVQRVSARWHGYPLVLTSLPMDGGLWVLLVGRDGEPGPVACRWFGSEPALDFSMPFQEALALCARLMRSLWPADEHDPVPSILRAAAPDPSWQ